MPRARLTAALLGSVLLITGAPLQSQVEFDDEDDAFFYDDDANDDGWDDKLDDDAVDIEDGGDNKADSFLFVEDEDIAFDEDDVFDLDDDGNDDADDAFDMFQDKLPRIELNAADFGGESDNEAALFEDEARARPALAPFGAIAGNTALTDRVNGWSVRSGQAKFQAQIRYKQDPRDWQPPKARSELPGPSISNWEAQHICGGTLIDKEWVITAAHCLTERHVGRGIEVMLGNQDIANPTRENLFAVERVVFHEGYYDAAWNKKNMYRNDIALIKLKPDPRLRTSLKIEPIPLYIDALPHKDVFLSTLGWGVTPSANDRMLNAGTARLFRADVKLIQTGDCAARQGFEASRAGDGSLLPRINDAVVCGGDTRSKACKGDSGGPVIFTNGQPMLVAIVSWTKGDGCGVSSAPGVYTRVASYAGWIKQVMTAPAGTVGRTVQAR